MTTGSDIGPAKTALREFHLRRRRERSEAERDEAAAAIAATLVGHLDGTGTVAAYVPLPLEPGAGRLPGALTDLDMRVLLPVVPDQGRQLDWAVAGGPLAQGRYGLLQPDGPRLGPEALGEADVVVVPALALDRHGVRLGRGGGYYDRALPSARPDTVLVAVVFDDELVDQLPAELHDRRIGAVVTPSGGWQDLGGAEDAAR
jgi:5-formyltetrahydrofolate cyclo-ligase